MKRIPLLLCLICGVGWGQGAKPVEVTESKLKPSEIFASLDQRELKKLAQVPLVDLWSVLRKGRSYSKLRTDFRKTLDYKDGFGRRTKILLDVPKNPRGILFLLHGLGGNRFHLGRGCFDQFAERENLILVAPDARKEPRWQRNEDLGFAGSVLQHWWSYRPKNFVLSLLRDLRRNYQLDSNRIYMAGHSMGGFGTWNIGLRYPDLFAGIVPISGGISRREYLMKKPDRLLRSLLYNAASTNVLFVHGELDQVVPVIHSRRSRDALKRLERSFDYVELAGKRHVLDLRGTSALAKGIGSWMKSHVRDAHPKSIEHRAIASYMRSAFWLRIDQAKFPGATVKATIQDGNKIKVFTQKVESLTLFVDEKWLNLSQPIVVTLNGKEVFRKRAPISRATMVESWLAKEDPDLIYRAKIELSVPQ